LIIAAAGALGHSIAHQRIRIFSVTLEFDGPSVPELGDFKLYICLFH
jgi:hypothetical protein